MLSTIVLAFMYFVPLQTPATVDRSGEPALRKVLADMGSLRGVRVELYKTGHVRKEQVMAPQQTTSIWYEGPTRFRILEMAPFGDGKLFVSDGQSLLMDTLDDTEDVTLENAGKNIYSGDPDLSLKGNSSAVFFYLLDGPSAFDKLVAPNSEIVSGVSSEPWVKFKSADVGAVTVFYAQKNGKSLVDRIEYDNAPKYEARVRAGSRALRPDGSLVVEEISYVSPGGRFSPSLFSTTPAKNRTVKDQRKKKPGGV